MLGKNAHPAELRAFKEKFLAFYKASMLHLFDIDVQHAYLHANDKDLEIKIQPEIKPGMPVFGEENSLFALLEEEFSTTWPMFNHRLDFFRFEQKEGQAFSNFVAKLELKAREADLQTLDEEEIMIH